MNFLKMVEGFFPTIIIGVEINSDTCWVTIKFYKNNKNIDTQTKSFPTTNKELPAKAAEYLKGIYKKYPLTYLATLPTSTMQTITNLPKNENFYHYKTNTNDFIEKTFGDWSIYISKQDITTTKEKFIDFGVDFIISPFFVLYHLIKSIPKKSCTLYLLLQETHLTMIITHSNLEILFSTHHSLDIDNHQENLWIDSTIDLIQSKINNFYKSDFYKSDFIDEIILFNPDNIKDETLQKIEDSLMLKTLILDCNISKILAELGYESYKFLQQKDQNEL